MALSVFCLWARCVWGPVLVLVRRGGCCSWDCLVGGESGRFACTSGRRVVVLIRTFLQPAYLRIEGGGFPITAHFLLLLPPLPQASTIFFLFSSSTLCPLLLPPPTLLPPNPRERDGERVSGMENAIADLLPYAHAAVVNSSCHSRGVVSSDHRP